MKKCLCLLFCILGCLFAAFWIAVYFVFGSKAFTYRVISQIMLINAIVVVLSLVLGYCVIKISVDQWFPNGAADIMSVKDRVLVTIVILVTVICAGVFVCAIVKNNFLSISVTELDNMLLRMLMLIIANTFMAFAYYQHFQVVQFVG